jgi:hypothetical protein
MWIGTAAGGILHFPTYTYTNMNGAGNTNFVKNIAHKGKFVRWFFVYFGYSKKVSKAYIHVKWFDGEDSMTYPNINHYFAPKFLAYVGKDRHYPAFNGNIGYFKINLG